jgi:hypothetical protein
MDVVVVASGGKVEPQQWIGPFTPIASRVCIILETVCPAKRFPFSRRAFDLRNWL